MQRWTTFCKDGKNCAMTVKIMQRQLKSFKESQYLSKRVNGAKMENIVQRQSKSCRDHQGYLSRLDTKFSFWGSDQIF